MTTPAIGCQAISRSNENAIALFFLPSSFCFLLPAFGDVRRGWYHVRLFEVINF
jgi:hypothetical protein